MHECGDRESQIVTRRMPQKSNRDARQSFVAIPSSSGHRPLRSPGMRRPGSANRFSRAAQTKYNKAVNGNSHRSEIEDRRPHLDDIGNDRVGGQKEEDEIISLQSGSRERLNDSEPEGDEDECSQPEDFRDSGYPRRDQSRDPEGADGYGDNRVSMPQGHGNFCTVERARQCHLFGFLIVCRLNLGRLLRLSVYPPEAE